MVFTADNVPDEVIKGEADTVNEYVGIVKGAAKFLYHLFVPSKIKVRKSDFVPDTLTDVDVDVEFEKYALSFPTIVI